MDLPKQIEWEAPEYDHFEKDANWFWTIGGAALGLVLIAILLKNFLFAIIILLGAFTVMLYGARLPSLIYFALTPKGLRVKDRLYPYNYLRSFWISDEHAKRKIIIESDRLLLPHLIILLPPEIDDVEAREYLLQYLPEVQHEESLIDLLTDYLGF